MRQTQESSSFRFPLSKGVSVALCFALVGLETAPAFARNNDDYQTNNNMYNNNYGSQGGYSVQSFDLQMQRMNARIQSFTAPPVQYFDSSRFTAPKLNLTYQPTIQFQYSPPVKTPEITTKALVKLDSFTPVQKPTFMENVGQVFKDIGSAISSAFKKIGDGIVAVVQKMFGTTKKEVPMTTPQAQNLMGTFKNLQEIAPGILETQRGKTVALGQTWEPGSKFKAEGNNLRLIQGTSYAPNFGGITRVDGADFPIRFADEAGKVKPIGLDFSLMAKETPLKIQAPLNIEGFGKIQGGNMVFKGTVNSPEGTIGKFQFQGAQIQLDSAMGGALDISSPASLARATFMVHAAVMELNSAVVEKGDKRVFVSRTQAPMEISGLEKDVNALDATSSTNFSKISHVERDLSARGNAVGQFFKAASQQTGLDATLSFEFKEDFKKLSKEAGGIRQSSLDLSQSVENESYDKVKEPLQNLQQRQEVLTKKIDDLESQAEPFRELQRGMRGVTNELVAMSPKIDADRLRTEAPLPDQELAYRATNYFPEEKARVCQQSDKALEGIKSLVKAGAMTPDQGANLGAQMMAMRDKILGAVPNDALYDQKRAVADPLQKTYDTSKNLVNRATDVAFFNVMGMEKLAEKYPKTGEAVGKFYLEEAKLAQTGAAVVGTAGLAYFAVNATITTGAALGTAYVIKNVLEYVGVNKEASTAYAAVTSFLVAAKVGDNPWVKQKEGGISEAVISKVNLMVRNVRAFMGDSLGLIANESGQILVPGKSKLPSVGQTVGGIQTPYGLALQEKTPPAIKALSDVRNGAKLYRLGVVDKQQIQEGQFWSLKNPLAVKDYANKMGLPKSNSARNDAFVTQATIKPGVPVVTRRAPGIGLNGGGEIEVVVNPGDVNIEWFHLLDKKGQP
jgi:hypothetical protein